MQLVVPQPFQLETERRGQLHKVSGSLGRIMSLGVGRQGHSANFDVVWRILRVLEDDDGAEAGPGA